MKRKTIFRQLLFSTLVFLSCPIMAFTTSPDCTVNDDCQQAITIPGVVADQDFVCIAGCNMYASPDTLIQSCQMGDYPTVWYKLSLGDLVNVVNIEVYSTDIESPVISVFKSIFECDILEQVILPGGNNCVIGVDGVAKAIGAPAEENETYYIAISSLISIGGNFDLCISAQTKGFNCVLDRNIEVKSRSNGGPLEGPFDPDETISICMNVNAYTASNNGCQWFQGIVPVFGNGWDPSSLDSNGQPISATVNADTIGEAGNGLYGTATWNWFTNADYHHTHPTLTIDDLDNNGRIDMCNSVYEVDCPYQGITGGCCTPCWDSLTGTFLPGGWFAYGINGTCITPGPPVGVDWGDGNSCGGPMGPWQFCFDLKTRDVPDCLGDSTTMDLSLGFFTFADGETGAWLGSESVCAFDVPIKFSFKAKCGRITTHDKEYLPPLCADDVFQYLIEESGISRWEWNISPYWAVPYVTNTGVNGFTIEAPLDNNTDQPVDVTGILIGYADDGSNDKVIKQFTFKLYDTETCETVSVESTNSSTAVDRQLRVYPVPANESVVLEWPFVLQKNATIKIYNTHGILQETIIVSSADRNQKRINTESLTPGIYYISLGNGDFRQVARMVIL